MRWISCFLMVLGILDLAAVETVSQPYNSEGQVPLLSCMESDSLNQAEYYAIDLVSTKKEPGTGQATGKAAISFERSPFGISVSQNGSFVHQLTINIKDIVPAEDATYVAWVTTPNLDKIRMLGILDENFQTSGKVTWNKYLVVITKESSTANLGSMWEGPIVMRGMSKSGYMHTMAGHGPFSQDPCAKYGYY